MRRIFNMLLELASGNTTLKPRKFFTSVPVTVVLIVAYRHLLGESCSTEGRSICKSNPKQLWLPVLCPLLCHHEHKVWRISKYRWWLLNLLTVLSNTSTYVLMSKYRWWLLNPLMVLPNTSTYVLMSPSTSPGVTDPRDTKKARLPVWVILLAEIPSEDAQIWCSRSLGKQFLFPKKLMWRLCVWFVNILASNGPKIA